MQVYNVVSGKTVKSMMSEYRKRKQTHTMPTFVRQARSRPQPEKKRSWEIVDDVDKEIDAQQKKSIMKVRFGKEMTVVQNNYATNLKYYKFGS